MSTSKSPRLLLPTVQPTRAMAKLKADIPEDLHKALLAYQEAYRELNAAEISLDEIIEHILKQHLRRDKAFVVWAQTRNIAIDKL